MIDMVEEPLNVGFQYPFGRGLLRQGDEQLAHGIVC